jgi:hypothetical protein
MMSQHPIITQGSQPDFERLDYFIRTSFAILQVYGMIGHFSQLHVSHLRGRRGRMVGQWILSLTVRKPAKSSFSTPR